MDDPASPTKAVTIYFDGSCPLCRVEITYFKTRMESDDVTFEDVSKTNAQLGPDLDPPQAMARFHARRADGCLVSGPDAFAEIWGRVPGWRWMASLSQRKELRWLFEQAYRVFLKVRPMLVRVLGPVIIRRQKAKKVLKL